MSTEVEADGAYERRWTRGAWLTLGGVLLFTLCQALIFSFAVAQPTEGCLILQGTGEAQVVRGCIGSWPTPLKAGDEVLAVGGRSLSLDVLQTRPPPPPAGWAVGAQVPYTVRRAGALVELSVPLQRMAAGDILRLLFGADPASLFTGLAILLVAVAAFTLRPGSAATQLLLLSQGLSAIGQFFQQAALLISQTAWNSWPSPGFWRLQFLLTLSYGWLSIPALLYLLLRFPRRAWPLTRWPRAGTSLLFGVAFGMSLLAVLTDSFLPYLAQLGLYATLIIIVFVGNTVGIFLRVRDPIVRAQAAWLGFGFAIFCSTILLWLAILAAPDFGAWLDSHPLLQTALSQAPNLALPICLAIAILRYRLFDIDVIIRRTLVYAVLTISLGAVYFGGVALLQALFVRLSGQESTLAVVASTLAIAALFLPLRARVQAFIDRRFFRQRYDARLVLAAFARRAQQESEVEVLSADILSTVQEALEPEMASVWITRAAISGRPDDRP